MAASGAGFSSLGDVAGFLEGLGVGQNLRRLIANLPEGIILRELNHHRPQRAFREPRSESMRATAPNRFAPHIKNRRAHSPFRGLNGQGLRNLLGSRAIHQCFDGYQNAIEDDAGGNLGHHRGDGIDGGLIDGIPLARQLRFGALMERLQFAQFAIQFFDLFGLGIQLLRQTHARRSNGIGNREALIFEPRLPPQSRCAIRPL